MSKMNTLNNILGNKKALDIIRVLSLLPEGASGREIASRAALSPQTALNTLNELEDLHLIFSRAVGRAKLYTLNIKHWFISDGLIPLWKKIDSWLDLLGQFYAERLPKPPICIIVYGSYARREETPESDLDLLFVFDDAAYNENMSDNILSLSSDAFERFGVSVSPKAVSQGEFKRAVKKTEGLMRNIFREGRSIHGTTVSEVLHYDSKED
jgi:predicted nucleotidyltransferase/DNA-binding transcriptional ArsR family regulator